MTKDDETDVTPADVDEPVDEVAADKDDVADDVAADEDDESETDADDTDTDDTDTDDTDTDDDVKADRTHGLVRQLLVPVVLVVVLLASAGLTAWAYFSIYRPDQQTSAAVSATVLKAASDGTVSLLSYAPDTMDKDFATAKSHLTGDFLNYYSQFTQDIVTPAVKTKAVKTSAAVVRSALSDLQPTSATVLLFVNQTTVSKENPDGAFAASSVKVGLTKIGNDWLISKFDPV